MRDGLAVALGLALSVLLAATVVAAQLALLQPPPPAAVIQGEYGVGGVIHVYVNGALKYKGPMNSFTENIARILYALLAADPYPVVTDVNGTLRTLNMTMFSFNGSLTCGLNPQPGSPPSPDEIKAAERFYLPLVYEPYFNGLAYCIMYPNGTWNFYEIGKVPPGAVHWGRPPHTFIISTYIMDLTYHGYPGARLYVSGPSLSMWTANISVPTAWTSYDSFTSPVTWPPPEWSIRFNKTHTWFPIKVVFVAPTSTPGPLKLTYARLMHDKDGNTIYVPMMEDVVDVALSAGDKVEVVYTVYTVNPPNGGGSWTFTLFVYEMLNPTLNETFALDGLFPTSPPDHYICGLTQTTTLHAMVAGGWSFGPIDGPPLPTVEFAVDPKHKPLSSITFYITTPYHRVVAPYYPIYLDGMGAIDGPLNVTRVGKTVIVTATFEPTGRYLELAKIGSPMHVCGAAVKVFSTSRVKMYYPMFSLMLPFGESIPFDGPVSIIVRVRFQ
jgi:hypothetical protein